MYHCVCYYEYLSDLFLKFKFRIFCKLFNNNLSIYLFLFYAHKLNDEGKIYLDLSYNINNYLLIITLNRYILLYTVVLIKYSCFPRNQNHFNYIIIFQL